jgi:hypothetical protein
MQSKETRIRETTLKARQSQNSPMLSGLETYSPFQQASECQPRVQQEQVQEKHEPLTIYPPRMQIDTPPRVRFNLGANEEQPFDPTTPPQLIVVSSAKPRIATSESIANRVKERRETPPSFGQSIAERVAQQRRESASPILNQDTGKMLEYHQLLRDPKHEAI